jgi:predicted RNA-binding protein with PUA-like domain
MKYWLMKSEPEEYSIDNLKADTVEAWTGIRNYQVRNMFRDEFKVGDLALFYHSNASKETGIVGIMEITEEAYPDPTQFDMKSAHPDPKSDLANPRWLTVDVKFIEKFPRTLTLSEIKSDSKLANLHLVQKGNRLSVMPLFKTEFNYLVKKAIK